MADVRRSESGSSSIDNGQLPRHETSTMSDERTPLLRRRVTPPVHTLGSSRSQTTTATPAASSRGSRVSSWIAKHAPQPGNWKLVLVWVAGLGAVGAIAALWIVSRSSSIILQLLSSLGSLSTCSTCFSLLLPARQLALLGDAAFTNTFTNLCIDLQIQPAYICKGAVGRQAPVIAQSLRRIQPNKRTAALLCSQLFGLCSIRGESIPDWGEEVFPVRNVTRQPATRTGKLRKIVHISDIHLDRKYKVGSEAVCGEVLCCRNTSSSLTSTGKPHWPAGPVSRLLYRSSVLCLCCRWPHVKANDDVLLSHHLGSVRAAVWQSPLRYALQSIPGHARRDHAGRWRCRLRHLNRRRS